MGTTIGMAVEISALLISYLLLAVNCQQGEEPAGYMRREYSLLKPFDGKTFTHRSTKFSYLGPCVKESGMHIPNKFLRFSLTITVLKAMSLS